MGNILKTALANTNLTYEEIASEMGVTVKTVHKWFDGKTKPFRIIDRQKLCKILGMEYTAGLLDNIESDSTYPGNTYNVSLEIKIPTDYVPIVDYVCKMAGLSCNDFIEFLQIFDVTNKNDIRFEILCYLYSKTSYGMFTMLILKMERAGLFKDIE